MNSWVKAWKWGCSYCTSHEPASGFPIACWKSLIWSWFCARTSTTSFWNVGTILRILAWCSRCKLLTKQRFAFFNFMNRLTITSETQLAWFLALQRNLLPSYTTKLNLVSKWCYHALLVQHVECDFQYLSEVLLSDHSYSVASFPDLNTHPVFDCLQCTKIEGECLGGCIYHVNDINVW